MTSQTIKKRKNKIYKSLIEVKDVYLPKVDLEFLECEDNDQVHEAFLKMLNNYAFPSKPKQTGKKE